MGIGFTEGLLIAAVVILLFGGKKLPELGKGMGEAIKNFKKGMKGEDDTEEKSKQSASLPSSKDDTQNKNS